MSLEENLEIIKTNIKKSLEKSKINQNVKLIAVTKTKPISIIQEAISHGIYSFGENKVQEAFEKKQ